VDLTAETNTATAQTNPKIVFQPSIGPYLQKALTPDQKNKFHTLILKCVAENDWSFNCIENPSFKRLIQFRNPCLGAALPSAKQLSNTLLLVYTSFEHANQLDLLHKLKAQCRGAVSLSTDSWES
jgi:hypothetical protein